MVQRATRHARSGFWFGSLGVAYGVPMLRAAYAQFAQFFVGAHFCKNMGKIRAVFWRKFGQIYRQNSGLRDLVHIQSVIDLFAKQLNNALNLQ